MTVLYADDDGDDCTLLQEALQNIDASIKCIFANNGEEALASLANQSTLPDLILLDINMPVMDGKTCLTELKRHYRLKNIPVVMYSTSSDAVEICQLLEMGASAFVSKPHTFNDLCETLEQVLARFKPRVMV